MKIKVGNYYKNRSGDVVHIVEHDTYGTYPYSDEDGNTYKVDGSYSDPYDEHRLDLIGVQF